MENQLVLFNVDHLRERERNREHLVQEVKKLQERIKELYLTREVNLHCPRDIADLVMYEMSVLDREELWLITLNVRNKVINIHKIYRGSINNSQVRIGDLFRVALLDNAVSIVIVHNHPSGDSTPSPDDVSVTRVIVQAGKLLEIEVLDHIIVARDGYRSLKEMGLGFS